MPLDHSKLYDADDAAVQALVRVVQLAVIEWHRARGARELLVQRAQVAHERAPLLAVDRRRAPRAQSLERADDVEQLVDVVLGERRDGEARLLRARSAHHETLLLETL